MTDLQSMQEYDVGNISKYNESTSFCKTFPEGEGIELCTVDSELEKVMLNSIFQAG